MQGPGRPKKARRSTEEEDWSDSASLGLSDPEQLDGSEDEGRLVGRRADGASWNAGCDHYTWQLLRLPYAHG